MNDAASDKTVPFVKPWSTAGDIYRFIDNVSEGDLRDQLCARLCHLRAMIDMTWGDEPDVFGRRPKETRDDFVWACASLLHECHALTLMLSASRRSNHTGRSAAEGGANHE